MNEDTLTRLQITRLQLDLFSVFPVEMSARPSTGLLPPSGSSYKLCCCQQWHPEEMAARTSTWVPTVFCPADISVNIMVGPFHPSVQDTQLLGKERWLGKKRTYCEFKCKIILTISDYWKRNKMLYEFYLVFYLLLYCMINWNQQQSIC